MRLTILQDEKVETQRPYQNSAITSVISVFYMTRNADIVETHRGVFVSEDELPVR
jgi:hypothetical protein